MSIFTIIYNILIGPLQLVFEIIFSLAYRLVDHAGLAIIALSLVMNILILPLYKRSDAMQEAARDIDAKLRDGVSHIKKTFSGDEQMMILQTYYRQNNYKPTDVLNGSVSLLLEVPFFMAAYNFLSHLEILNGVSLGPIADLGAPDGLLTIAGVTINVLPVIMTLVNVVSSAIYTKGFPLKTKIQLYAMALFFLAFLYTSPSGLVFYWTLNNIFSFGKNIVYKIVAFVKKRESIQAEKELLNNKKINVSNNKSIFVLGSLLLTILVGVLIPSTFIGSSTQEFIDATYYYDPTWFIVNSLCLAAGTFLVWMRVFYWISGPVGKMLFDIFVWIMCGIMLVNYLFFGTNLGIISSALEYENGMNFSNKEILLNLIILLLVALVMYFIIKKARTVVKGVLITVAIALFAMSAMNVVGIRETIKITEEQLANSDEGTPHFTLSKEGQNVIVLMLDRGMGAYIPYIFDQYPELQEQFSGFTYYSNVLSHGKHTNFGAPGLFGGYEYVPSEMNKRDDESLVSKHNEALKVMPVIFDQNGYDVTVCDAPYANYKWIPDMSIYDEYPEINTYVTEGKFSDPIAKEQAIENNKRNFFCFSLMKTLPLCLQEILYQDGKYNQLVVERDALVYSSQTTINETKAEGVSADFMDAYNVLLNLKNMTRIDNEASNQFLLLCNNTTHNPMMLQLPEYEPAQKVDNTQYIDELMPKANDGIELKMSAGLIRHYHSNVASLMRLGEWFDYLKENNLYDNTRIILVSDHGYYLRQINELLLGKEDHEDIQGYYPLLMVKDFNSKEFKTSDEFMTNADVPTMAFESLIENPMNPFTGKMISNEDKFLHEQYVITSSKWRVEENSGNEFIPSQWYAVKDNIWDKENWRLIEETLTDPAGY